MTNLIISIYLLFGLFAGISEIFTFYRNSYPKVTYLYAFVDLIFWLPIYCLLLIFSAFGVLRALFKKEWKRAE